MTKIVSILTIALLFGSTQAFGPLKGLSEAARKYQRQVQNELENTMKDLEKDWDNFKFADALGLTDKEFVQHKPHGKEITDEDVAEMDADEAIIETLTLEDNTEASNDELYRIWE